jgi:hypothetical protein
MHCRLNRWTEHAMQDYRCYFLSERGRILFPADISAGDLEAAKQHGFVVLQEGVSSLPIPPRTFEIWEENVMLFRS